jgi:hypothetical protein
MRLIIPQIKNVRCCLLCTSIEDECCKNVGKLLNSSAITRIDEATNSNVVNASDTSSTMQLQELINFRYNVKLSFPKMGR